MTEPSIYEIGQAASFLFQSAGKTAADSSLSLSYSMKGQLTLSSSGYVILQVPNDLGNGAFKALREPGIEQPISKSRGKYNAHISVIRPEEVEAIGGPSKLQSARGTEFSFTTGAVREIANPSGWKEVSKCWVIEAKSPELMQLRKSLGLGEPKFPFHITFAIRKKNAFRKSSSFIHGPLPAVNRNQVEKFASVLSDLVAARKATAAPKSPEQAEAGNYKKGKLKLHGLTISLENPKGSTRSGVAPDGKKWSTKMKYDYGYFLGSVDNDGDAVDVFIGPEPEIELVYVVDQIDPRTKKFDEHKVLMGFSSLEKATDGYLANYEKGWQGLGKIVPMTLSQFKQWLASGDHTKPTHGIQLKAASDVNRSAEQLLSFLNCTRQPVVHQLLNRIVSGVG
jgi:hypothetical protein